MKKFPREFESRKPILIYPKGSSVEGGDVLEIGPGRGDLLMDLAEAWPDKQFVAIEIAWKRFHKLIPRIEKRGLKNIQLLRGDARIVLDRFFEKETFEKIYVLFPDPWPKKRHALKRLLQIEFIELLQSYLQPEGSLFFATDVAWYADWVIDNCRQVPSLVCTGDPFVNAEDLFGYTPTFFEQKWRAEGRQIYYLWYQRGGHA